MLKENSSGEEKIVSSMSIAQSVYFLLSFLYYFFIRVVLYVHV